MYAADKVLRDQMIENQERMAINRFERTDSACVSPREVESLDPFWQGHPCLGLRWQARVEDYFVPLSGDLFLSSSQLPAGERLAFVLPSVVVSCQAWLVPPSAVCTMLGSIADVPYTSRWVRITNKRQESAWYSLLANDQSLFCSYSSDIGRIYTLCRLSHDNVISTGCTTLDDQH
jgi:hypothetical protein